jgi:hypothetical protein
MAKPGTTSASAGAEDEGNGGFVDELASKYRANEFPGNGLAEQLGRTFEARGFLTVEISEDPQRDDLRDRLRELGRQSASIERPQGTLADAVAREFDQE